MALKKETTGSQEQLYMLEVMVDRVTLNPEQSSKIAVEDLTVRVRFSNLPECEISVLKQDTEDADNPNNFGYGKSCLFSRTPSCLIRAIRWSPLYMDVYKKDSASSKNDGVFVGTARITLPACMCNYVIEAQKESKESSKPCIANDTFDIIDHGNNVFGSVTVVLRLSCFGSSIVKQFSLNEKSFVLEDSPLQKFVCPYIAHGGATKEDDKSLLKRPVSPPRVTMNDPAFKTLTSAEKLNDPKYRELVYRTFPNEPTCSCLPKDRSTHPMKCRSGCNRCCCMRLRNPKILDKPKGKRIRNTYCVNRPLPVLERPMPVCPEQDIPCCKKARLKGGGDVEQLYLGTTSTGWTDDMDYNSWYDQTLEPRLEGGGEFQMTSCSCSGGQVPISVRSSSSKDRAVVTMFDACTPRITPTGPKPTCICPGKEPPTWPRGAARCMKKPCMGIDCLIRAFEDAQEFVNSIGKVPGLPGLGLMDPSESPFFGRDIDKDYVSQEPLPEPQKKKGQAGIVQKAEVPRCTAPCNLPSSPGDDPRSRMAATYAPTTTVGLPLPPRLGIVREAIPMLPEAASVTGKHKKSHDKKEEKADKHKDLDSKIPAPPDMELGPCGEPKCKSRKKSPADALSVTQSTTNIASKAQKKPKASRRKGAKGGSKGKSKRRSGRRGQTEDSPGGAPKDPLLRQVGTPGQAKVQKGAALGPGGDLTQPAIPVSKRIMRYVYFVGDYYPGIAYGHRRCIDIPMRVPANMGWLWNSMATVGKLKPRLGWKPGAIGRYLYEMLQEAKEYSLAGEDSQTSLTKSKDRSKTDKGGKDKRLDRGKGLDRNKFTLDRGKSAPSRQRGRAEKTRSFQNLQQAEDEEEDPEYPPTLHIHRKDGTYYVTMYPIKQEAPSDDPRLPQPMKPLQFKIVKNKDDASDASSSTASDMEIEFSPPAAVSRYRKKPDVVHVDTQVRQQEILDAIKTELKKRDKRGRLNMGARRKEQNGMLAPEPEPTKKKEKSKKEKKDKK